MSSVDVSTMKKTHSHLYFLDNLRVVLVMLVIAHHVGQAYGPTGGFWPIQEETRAAVLGPFFTVNRSFFMSLFFMIAGYFTVMVVDKKGPRAFLKERGRRLGMPVLFFGLFVLALQWFVFDPPTIFPVEMAHLWFLEHLLIFSAVYALWRMFSKQPVPAVNENAKTPGVIGIVVFALLLAVVSAVVRIWFPIDRWVYLLGFIKVAFADVPRDLSFFIIGLVAYRRNWILGFPTKAGLAWLGVGVVLAVFWYAFDLFLWKPMHLSDLQFGIMYPIWESLLCCSLAIGLTVLFREFFNHQGRLWAELAKSQYSVYIFHLLVVIFIQYLVLSFALPPLSKFILVTLVSIPATFLICQWLRKPLGL